MVPPLFVHRLTLGHCHSFVSSLPVPLLWSCDGQVDVLCVNTGQLAKFYYAGWLAKDEPPYQLQVELFPVGGDGKPPLCRWVGARAGLVWSGFFCGICLFIPVKTNYGDKLRHKII